MSAPANSLACAEQEITRAEEEAHQHLVFLTNLRAKRNSLLPVYRLPSETLAIIFVHGARDYHENKPARCTSCVPSWVNVSYACTRWRNIALNCPALWTYPFNLSLRWTEELLLRSKQASLKISCVHPDQSSGCSSPPDSYQRARRRWWLSNLDHLLQHSERIQELRLCLAALFIPKLSLRIPRLENLEIQFYEQPDPDEWSLAIIGDTPVLRKLKLVYCPLPWYSLSLRRLNTLYLSHTLVQSDMGEFLVLLRDMQDLSILQLKCALPSARGFLSGGGLGTSLKINLPRLAFLAVVAPASTVAALLSCVSIPLETRLNLKLLYEDSSSIHDCAPIPSFLAQQFSTPQQQSSPGPILRSLTINADYTPCLTFSSLERDYNPPSQTEESGHNIPLEITLGDYSEELEEEMPWDDKHRVISKICSSQPSTQIQSLHVIQPFRFSVDLWREMLGHLDGLRHMKLSYDAMPDLSALFLAAHEAKESPGGGSAPPTSHIFIPALEELELDHIIFADDTIQQQLFSAYPLATCHDHVPKFAL